MNKDFKHMPSGLNNEIEQEKLIQYLNKELSDKEQQSIESRIIDDEFINDAMEGLEQIKNIENIQAIQKELNIGINKQIKNRNKRKDKRVLKDSPWIYFAVILLLLLLGVAFFVITKFIQ